VWVSANYVLVTEVFLWDCQSRQARQHHSEYSPLVTFHPPKGKLSTRFHPLLPPPSDDEADETGAASERDVGTTYKH
jgi:hypothetical protein